jgi:hypothetical protein
MNIECFRFPSGRPLRHHAVYQPINRLASLKSQQNQPPPRPHHYKKRKAGLQSLFLKTAVTKASRVPSETRSNKPRTPPTPRSSNVAASFQPHQLVGRNLGGQASSRDGAGGSTEHRRRAAAATVAAAARMLPVDAVKFGAGII